MPPRRSHTKSRNGCDQCKKRRVKCDEQGPPCSNCISRELDCTYLKVPTARSLSGVPAPPVNMQTQNADPLLEQDYQQSPSIQLTSSSTISDKRSLELMHKFSTETYQSLCNEPSDLYVWQIVVPQRALDHDFLMSGILSIASLHIASTLDPPDALAYANTALEYHSQALTPFRHAINDLNPENCEAVFAHSVVTTIFGIALPHLTSQREEFSSITENITVVFELLQGVSKIHNITRSWLKTKLFTTGNTEFWNLLVSRLDEATEAALDHLDTLTNDTSINPELQRIFKGALELLRRCFIRFSSSKDIASVLAWLAIVKKEFVDALRCREPLALLILMYWGVLLHGIDGTVWWARNSGSALVMELSHELRDHDTEWESALSWPKQQISRREPPVTENNHYNPNR